MATILLRQDTTDWAKKYENLQATANMPYTKNTFTKPKHFVYRDFVVNLQSVINTVNALPNKPIYIYVIADVVYFPKEWNMADQGYFIFARRCIYGEIGNAARTTTVVNMPTSISNAAALTIYTNEVVGNIAAVAQDIVRAEPYHKAGIRFARGTDGKLAKKDLDFEDLAKITNKAAMEHVATEIDMSLSCLYHMATLMIETDNDTARAVMGWIKTLSTNSNTLFNHFAKSSALLAELNLEASKVNFVPVLSAKVYENIAQGYLDAVSAYETQYLLFVQDGQSKRDQVTAGKLMLDCCKTTTELTDNLIRQAESNVAAAAKTLDSAKKSMEIATESRTQASRDFAYGIERWKEETKLEAAIQICTALISFGAVVGKMFMADPEAAATAGAAVNNAAKSAEAIKAAAEAGKKVSAFNQAMINFQKSMESLSNIGEILAGMGTLIGEIKKAVDTITGTGSINDFILPSSSDISAQAEWDVFRLQCDDMLSYVEELGVGGAAEFRQSLDVLSIYGKAQAAAQAALLQVNQEVVRLYLQKAANIKIEESVANYIKTLESDVSANEKAKYDVFALQLNMKGFMFNALRNYIRAYKYWSLIDSMVKPSLSSTAKKLQEDLAKMKSDYAVALLSFGDKALQDIGVGEGIKIEITDPVLLKTFRDTGVITYAVPLDEDGFLRYQRVRITRVRAWLNDGTPNRNVRLTISNSGVYADRFDQKNFTFSSKATALNFDYDYENGTRSIVVDGMVAKELEGAYFQPTPFTEWKITAATRETAAARALVNKITLRFTGTALRDPLQLIKLLQAKQMEADSVNQS